MSFSIINEDLRSMKTKKALYAALFSFLRRHNFRKITIKAICDEAKISRAIFYRYFTDKYDLLKHWITELWLEDFSCKDTYVQIEKVINHHMYENMPVLKNLVDDADNETFDILFDCILSAINLNSKKNTNREMSSENKVFSNFCAGGIMSYLLCHVKNKFPSEIPPMNRYFYEMIQGLQEWQLMKEKIGDDLQ